MLDKNNAKLRELTGKKHALVTKRANQSIRFALRYAKSQGFENVYIPQCGGWMTYRQFAEKHHLIIHEIPTVDENIDVSTLEMLPKSIILLHSLGGYHHLIDTAGVRAKADEQNALFIEDVCGVFPKQASHGHIVLGSFGNAKPINVGHGGFVATDDTEAFSYLRENTTQELTDEEQKLLLTKLDSYEERFTFLYAKRDEVLSQLDAKFEPICDEHALVIIVPFSSEEEKEELITFVLNLNLEYTECPRYIRHNKPAISIEIKRL